MGAQDVAHVIYSHEQSEKRVIVNTSTCDAEYRGENNFARNHGRLRKYPNLILKSDSAHVFFFIV